MCPRCAQGTDTGLSNMKPPQVKEPGCNPFPVILGFFGSREGTSWQAWYHLKTQGPRKTTYCFDVCGIRLSVFSLGHDFSMV